MNLPNLSNFFRQSFPGFQRGAVSVAIVMLLLFILAAAVTGVLKMSGSSVIDAAKNEEQISALFLAESGTERAQSLINAASNPAAASACTGITGSFPLGRGTFSLSSTSTPTGCTTACTGCIITSTGTVGSASRTLARTIAITPGSSGGVSCNSATTNCTNLGANPPSVPPTWSLTVTNTTGQPALALLHLAATRQGNPSSANCTAQSNCQLKWVINSQNGDDSVVSMGNLYSLAIGASTPTVFQTITSNRPEDVAFSAVLFPGTTNPTAIGAYWDDTQNGSGGTHGKEHDSDGTTNDGTATSSGNCTTNPAPAPSTTQSCTNWCYGGDRLIFGFAGGAEHVWTDKLDSVTFNTNGAPSQNIVLSKISHFPTLSTLGASGKVYSELWSAYNPNLSPTPTAVNVSSYKGNGTGAIGATWTGSNNTVTSSGTVLNVGTFSGYPNQIISPGDRVSSNGTGNDVSSVTISSQLTSTEAGGALGGRGTYALSGNSTDVSDSSGRNWTATSTVLNVSACTSCFFANGDSLSGLISGRTINAAQLALQTGEAAGGIGRYPISGTATTVASAATLKAGTAGTTLYLPSTSSMPTVSTPPTRIAMVSGTGALAANTTVTAIAAPNAATNSFTVSVAPNQALNNATICGGTCAFFDHTSATTDFSILRAAGSETEHWASGFICLSGADIAPVIGSTGSAPPVATSWHEVVK